jgi:hypothetical protein
VYLSVKAFSETDEAKKLDKDGEEKRFLDHILRDFKR